MAASIFKIATSMILLLVAAVVMLFPEKSNAQFWPWEEPPRRRPQRPYYPPPQYPPYPGDPWDPYNPDYWPGGEDPGQEQSAAKKAIAEFQNQPHNRLPIFITKTQWTDADEAQFGAFVAKLGTAISSKKCSSVKSCMQSREANMYAAQDPEGLIMYSDCADFPYFLRAYFAYHNGLPFGFVNQLKMSPKPYASINDKDQELADKRLDNGPYGNLIMGRGGSNVADRPNREIDLLTYLERLFNTVSTRTYRVGPLSPGYSNSDLYPVKIDKSGIRPGTVVHSTGHALIVWKVDPKGRIHAIDAHPDGSVQFKQIQQATLDRSRPDQGLGFFKFRPLRLVGAKQAPNGAIYGGKIVPATDQDLYVEGKLSLEQWFGVEANVAPGTQVAPTLWQQAFKKPKFHDYVGLQLRDANLVLTADENVRDMMEDLCNQFQQRVADVDAYVKEGINKQQHPSALPANIFGHEDATWSAYSTPGRDSRIRASVSEIIKAAINQFRSAKTGDGGVKFEGDANAYVAALRGHLQAMEQKCEIKYKNSRDRSVTLKFSQILSRLNRLSFDPYLCPEKAWGASGEELKSCSDTDRGNRWYDAEQPMRNTVGKVNANEVFVIRSDRPITIDMLTNPANVDRPDNEPMNLGSSRAPVMNLDANFASPRFIELLTK